MTNEYIFPSFYFLQFVMAVLKALELLLDGIKIS